MIHLQEIELVFGHTDARTHTRTDGRTDRRGSRNIYLDFLAESSETRESKNCAKDSELNNRAVMYIVAVVTFVLNSSDDFCQSVSGALEVGGQGGHVPTQFLLPLY